MLTKQEQQRRKALNAAIRKVQRLLLKRETAFIEGKRAEVLNIEWAKG